MLAERAVNFPALTVKGNGSFVVVALAKVGKSLGFRLAFGSVAAETGGRRSLYVHTQLTDFKLVPACVEIVVKVNASCVCLPYLVAL